VVEAEVVEEETSKGRGENKGVEKLKGEKGAM
jgi:hypothetical protein